MFPAIPLMRAQAQAILNASNATNAVDAVLHWRTFTGHDPEAPPWDETSANAANLEAQDHTLPFRALFHQVGHRASGFQRFSEIEAGDIILDYLTDLDLTTKQDTRVVIQGRTYVQKSASRALLEAWDAASESTGIFRTLLLTPAH